MAWALGGRERTVRGRVGNAAGCAGRSLSFQIVDCRRDTADLCGTQANESDASRASDSSDELRDVTALKRARWSAPSSQLSDGSSLELLKLPNGGDFVE